MKVTLEIAQRNPSAPLGMTLPMRTRLGILVFLASAIIAHAAETIPPKPDRYFNDYAGVVSAAAAQRFNEQLAQFERDTSNQFVVAFFKKMQSDSDIADYTRRVALSWDIGQKLTKNGVALFVFIEDRKMFIQTAHGVEGALPDVTCFDITERHIKPRFRAGDYEGGLAEGIDLVCKAIRGEYKGTGKTARESGSSQNSSTAGLLVFFLILILILLAMRASRRFGGYRYTGGGGPFISGNWGSGWSGGSGGGWSSGGGNSFSGFSGGGGGSGFGGGGAGSSW